MNNRLTKSKNSMSMFKKILYSWWVVLSFFGYAWAGFLYIGFRTKTMRWIITGSIYSLIFFLRFGNFYLWLANEKLHLPYSQSEAFSNGVFIAYIIASLIHSLISDPEFLLRMDILKKHRLDKKEMRAWKTASNIRRANHFAKVNDFSAESQEPKGKININSCTESELAALPGVNTILAKKAMQYRLNAGSFSSVSAFVSYLHLRPAFADKLEKTAYAGPAESVITEHESIQYH